jgi:hypothetical protein
MCDHRARLDFPIAERLDDSLCTLWLARPLQLHGLVCPPCGHSERRLVQAHGPVPAYRGRACDGDSPLLPGTVFDKTRPRPATLVWLWRGRATGEPAARLARAWGRSRQQRHTRRPRLQGHRQATAPTAVRRGTAFEADELCPQGGGQQARLTLTRQLHPGGAPTSVQGLGRMPTIARPSSGSSRATRARNAGGAATRPTGRPAVACLLATGLLGVRGSRRRHGNVIVAVIPARPRCPTRGAYGCGRTMVMASARSLAIPARGRAPRSGPLGVPSGVSTHRTCLASSRRMPPWSMPNASHQHGSNGCVLVTCL